MCEYYEDNKLKRLIEEVLNNPNIPQAEGNMDIERLWYYGFVRDGKHL